MFVVVMAALLYAVIRYRRRLGDDIPEQIHGNTRLEIAWSIAPALILIAVAIPTVITIFDNANSPLPPEKGGLEVEVIAHQWWFEFRYPEANVVTANELHIPVGEVVNLKLDSVDVIHSFWIPKLAGKVDMIPNSQNTMWIQADQPGDYYGQCAEFCGESHANMKFRVVAEPLEDFDNWLQAQSVDAVEPVEPLAKQGHDLFISREASCFACHTISGSRRAQGQVGPNLTHFASRQHFAGSILENTQDNLRKWLQDPQSVKPGNLMARDATIYTDPNLTLTEPEISALIAYLQSLK